MIGVRKGLGVHGDTLLIKSLASMSELTTLTSPQGNFFLFLNTGLFIKSCILEALPVNQIINLSAKVLCIHAKTLNVLR